MLKLALILAAMIVWGAWLVAQDKWGVASFVVIPVFVAALAMQATLFKLVTRQKEE